MENQSYMKTAHTHFADGMAWVWAVNHCILV